MNREHFNTHTADMNRGLRFLASYLGEK